MKSNLKVASEVPSKFTIIHDLLLHQQQQQHHQRQQPRPQPAASRPASNSDPPRKYSNFDDHILSHHQRPSSTSKNEPNLLLLATLIPNSTNIRPTSMENEPGVKVLTTTRLSTEQSKIFIRKKWTLLMY